MNPQFQEGDVARIPWPSLPEKAEDRLNVLGAANVTLARKIASNDEVDHAFARVEADEAFEQLKSAALAEIESNEAEADRLLSGLVGLSVHDRAFMAAHIVPRWTSRRASNWFFPSRRDDVSYFCGCALGRWDIQYATGEKAAPELPDPFAPLPVCPPGQLQNERGLPVTKAESEKLKAEKYPIEIPWDGILVDDPHHPLDIERRVREVIEIIWGGRNGESTPHPGPLPDRGGEGAATPESIEHEACEILGVKSFRDYFRKPAGFFADHLKRYSKSRRQAPIYWPLSTASGSYTLWIYYHRLTDQTLFQCVNDFVKPKIAEVEADLSRFAGNSADKPGARAEIERLATLRAELIEFRDELLRVAQLPYKPNLNDGVLITASPLWKLFRLPKWQKDLKACWESVSKGEYDWAHLAYTIWPARVREVCKKDRSIAIAHGLEELCEAKAPEKKKTKKKHKEQMELEEESA